MTESIQNDSANPPTIAMITAGAGGMYCGSCLHDNLIAKGLCESGVDAVLIPTYTPLRTDLENVSIDRVFFGGINVFLQEKVGLFRSLPKFFDRWLDHPGLIRWITSRKMDTDPSGLGPLTLSMLRGSEGRQKKEVAHLTRWLAEELKPDLVVFSNLLIAGCAPDIKRELGCPILVTLQGDDVFLDGLPAADKQAAISQMNQIANSVDGFLTHSDFYADYMSEYLSLPRDKMHTIPLGLEGTQTGNGVSRGPQIANEPPVVGYLARLAPEKGLHILCEAFAKLRSGSETPNVRLKIAGWQDQRHQAYADAAIKTLRDAAGHDVVEVIGEVTHAEKVAFLNSLDVFCVPTEFKEPKGLYVLEAMAAGLPVVQPDHGAFPELLEPVGGTLFEAGNVDDLANKLQKLLQDPAQRQELAEAGLKAIWQRHRADVAVEKTMQVYASFLN